MAVLFRKVLRLSDPTNKDSVKKVYPVVTYKYGNPGSLDEFAKEISSNSGVSEGETISVLKDFRTLLKKTLLGGRSVNIEGLGFFFLAAQSKGSDTMEEFTAQNITGLRICFRAHNEIRLYTGTATRTDGLKLKDIDRIYADDEEPGSGDGGGDVEDPTV